MRLLFPRMELAGIPVGDTGERTKSYMPSGDVALFYRTVVLGAVKAITPNNEVYWPFDHPHAYWKSHSKTEAGLVLGQRTVSNTDVHRLMMAMHGIVNNPDRPDHAELAKFMNFILFYDAQDLKLTTNKVSNGLRRQESWLACSPHAPGPTDRGHPWRVARGNRRNDHRGP